MYSGSNKDKQRITLKQPLRRHSKRILRPQSDLIGLFNSMLVKFKRHAFHIRQQYRHCSELKRNMAENECIIHVDFTENYICRYASEIQAVHFGASHEQATLHTGDLYVGPDVEPVCFSTISPSKLKGPPSHMWTSKPHFFLCQEPLPCCHGGPFLQQWTVYAVSQDFYLFASLLHEKGFQARTWNFFEAGHGKGSPDGVGGVAKRAADRLVSHGHDILNAKDLLKALVNTGTTLKLSFVNEVSTDRAMQDMPDSIPQVQSTMKIHQVVTTSPGKMLYRDVSCMCTVDKILWCTCHNTKVFSFHTPSTSTTDEMEPKSHSKVVCHKMWWRPLPKYHHCHCWGPGKVRCLHCVAVNRFFWSTRWSNTY